MLILLVLLLVCLMALQEPKAKSFSWDLVRGLLPTLLALVLWKGHLTAEVACLTFLIIYLLKVIVLKQDNISIPILIGSIWPLAPETIGLMAASWLAGLLIFRQTKVAQLMWVLSGCWGLGLYRETWLATLGILLVIIVIFVHIIKQWFLAQGWAGTSKVEKVKRGEINETIFY